MYPLIECFCKPALKGRILHCKMEASQNHELPRTSTNKPDPKNANYGIPLKNLRAESIIRRSSQALNPSPQPFPARVSVNRNLYIPQYMRILKRGPVFLEATMSTIPRCRKLFNFPNLEVSSLSVAPPPKKNALPLRYLYITLYIPYVVLYNLFMIPL